MGTNYYWQPPVPSRCKHCGQLMSGLDHEWRQSWGWVPTERSEPDEDHGGYVAPPRGRLHIGKSSAGNVFVLRLHPTVGVLGLADWCQLLAVPGSSVVDEYGDAVKPGDLMATMLLREPREGNTPAAQLQAPERGRHSSGLTYAEEEREFS